MSQTGTCNCKTDLDCLCLNVPFSLSDLESFIKVVDTGMQVEVHEGDYDALVSVIEHLKVGKISLFHHADY